MRYVIIPTLLGLLTFAEMAATQAPLPPRSYPVPSQYYPEDEHTLVRSWYRRYLNREGDPVGVALWVGSLRQGNPPEAVLATILASDEYYRKARSTPDGLAQTLFLDVAGRTSTGAERGYWVNRLHRGERVDVIYDFLLRYPQTLQDTSPRYAEENYRYERPYRYYRPK